MSRVQALVHDVREFFVLREGGDQARGLPEARLEKLRGEVALSRQKREAAQTLWLHGSRAEAMRLATEALERLSATASDLVRREEPEPPSTPPPPRPLEAFILRRDPALLSLVGEVLKNGRAPVLDADVTTEDGEAFDAAIAAHIALDIAISPLTQSDTERMHARIKRSVLTAFTLVALLLVAVGIARSPRALKVEGTPGFNNAYPPEQVIDGRKETEWVLPDHVQGWVDVQVIPARKVTRVRLLNMHNPPYNDRATKDFQVQALLKGKVVKVVDGSWPEFSENPDWTAIELGATVDHVRFEVKGWHRLGGGLAEIAIE